LPLIVTVRHPLEGGAGALSAQKRRELFEKFLPHAAFVDVELRSVKELASVLNAARQNGVKIILSHHDFK
jgi:3-dehydroquinate dehydratase-1